MGIDSKKFKAQLLARQAELESLNALTQDAAKTVDLDQNRVGRLSRMDAMQGQAMAQANADRQQRQLRSIEQALSRIALGSYGRCKDCDELITIGRLEADPTVDYCIDCAQRLETQ